MDLLLVNPNSKKTYGNLSKLSAIEPPFWAGLIASFIRWCGYSVAILDGEAGGLTIEETTTRAINYRPKLIAIVVQGSAPSTSSTPKMMVATEFIKALDGKAPTILIGIHPSALPDRTLRETGCGYVCQGEGFYTILRLLQQHPLSSIPGLCYLYGKNLVCNSRAGLLEEDQLPPVAWDLLDMTKYRAHNWHCLDNLDARQPYGVIYTSLGCPFYCNFCNIHQMYLGDKPSIRYRKVEEVVAEVDLLVKYGVRNIKIMDELFALRQERVEKICDSLIERNYGLNIWAYGRVDTVNENMLRKMKQAGINWVAYGFESANETIRQGVSKKFSQKKMIRAIEMTRAVGINIIANVMFGLPDDSLKTMQQTLEMAKEFNFEWFNAYVTMPYPGSQLYEEAVRQGTKLPERWADWGQYSEGLMPLPTKYLSSKEIVAFRDKAFTEYFSRSEYLRMIKEKFGDKAVEHIKEMLRQKIERGITQGGQASPEEKVND